MTRLSALNYPVGTPFHAATPPPVDPAARLRRWTWGLLGAAGLLLIVTMTAGFVWSHQGQRAPAPAPAKESVAATETPPPAPQPRIRAALLLDVLGGLSGAHLCQTFFTLGMLEDGVEDQTYTKAEADKTLSRTLLLMNQVDGYLEKLKDAGLSSGDLRAVARIQQVSSSLRAQATALRAYWRDGEKTHAERCRAARERAWIEICELQGKD
jgi:hypothetical protein